MTGQFREKIGPLQDTCKGLRAWIVGTGPSLDSVDLLRLQMQYVFALNGAIEFFKEDRKFPDTWWIWHDMRTFRELWPELQTWPKLNCIIHRKGFEELRQYRGGGRFVLYGKDEIFKLKRSVAETAMAIVNFLGFSEAVLVGVDGMAANKKNRPYCKEIDRKKSCRFMDPKRPGSWKASAGAFDEAMGALLPKLTTTKFIQTSPIYPNRKRFEEYCSFLSVFERDSCDSGSESKV